MVLTVLARGLAAQQPSAGKPSDFVPARPRQQAPLGGLVCQNINYYGVADEVPVPAFDGVTSSRWVGAFSYALRRTSSINFPTPMASGSYVYATDFATLRAPEFVEFA
jgi:hypothetical protein